MRSLNSKSGSLRIRLLVTGQVVLDWQNRAVNSLKVNLAMINQVINT